MATKWLPSIDDTTEFIGIILLFTPYIIILLPLLQTRITDFFHSLYLHRTPRDDWNSAVDQHPPRRLLGYIFSIIFSFTAVALLLIKNHSNAYWIDFFQYFIYLSMPLIISVLRPPSHRPCDIFDFLIILLVIVPINISQEFDSFLPDITFVIYPSYGTSPNISILRLCGFNLFLFIFFIFRRLSNIGLSWNITNNKKHKWSAIQWVFLRLVTIMSIFLSLAIPFCLIPDIKYLHSPVPVTNIWIDGIARYFCLFFLEILVIEFLYRGIVQNLLHSALDFRFEAGSYLRGRSNSLTSLNQFETESEEESDHGIELLWKSRKKPLIVDDTKAVTKANKKELGQDQLSVNGVDKDTNTIHTMYSFYNEERDTLSCTAGFCYFLRFDNLRDWFVIFMAAVVYAITVLDYKNYESEMDLLYGFILMFWFGLCCGWLFRLTNSCFVSAVFNSLFIFNAKYVFNYNQDFCNGACQ